MGDRGRDSRSAVKRSAGGDPVRVRYCRIEPGDETCLPGLLGRLSQAERSRAERFASPVAKLAYATAHALLHDTLDAAIGTGWTMVVDERGKPALAPPFADLHFNLTHADALVAVATHQGGPVGIDAEACARAIDVAGIGRRVFAVGERGDPVRLWTLKEAVAKATGLGLALPFNTIVFDRDPPRLASIPDAHGPVDGWWIDSRVVAGHWLSLATPQGSGDSECRECPIRDLAR